MRTKVIKAHTIDVAVEGILNEINISRQNVIYFDGWEGLGASAVLRAIARRMELKEPSRPPGLSFEQVIHVDCSEWESTRALQREIAKQLKLPTRVMKMLDEQDDDDDFNGTDQSSRTEIADVAAEIQWSTQGHRFLLVFHNGSNEEIDISSLGLPVYVYLTNKVIWTFQGRFRIDPKMKDKVTKNTTNVLLSASCYEQDREEFLSYLLHEEATQVACKHDISPAIVVECFLYLLKLNCIRGHHVGTEYDLAVHTCNYWMCDGIVQKITDTGKAWQVGETLQGEIRLDMHYHQNNLPSHLLTYIEKMPHWTSPAYGFVLFSAAVVPSGTFQPFDKLGVIKLSRCSFSFSSPPFLCCHNLRFLWLDHCQDFRSTDADQGAEEEDITQSCACFQSLWVLDLRYTDYDLILSARVMDLMTQLRELNVVGAKNWDMSCLRGRLRNIRKLRVTKSTCFFNHDVLSEMESMELLVFSGNICTQGTTSLCGPASNSILKTVFIDGCDSLKMISFRGCKELKNLFLKGFIRGLNELDLSGTSVKTLDLRGVDTSLIPFRIILVGCEKLRAMLWPPNVVMRRWREVLHIDTTSPPLEDNHADLLHQQKEEMFKGGWRISITDTRLLRSLSPVRGCLVSSSLHIDIFPASAVGGSNIQGTSADQPVAVAMMWDCPKIYVYSFGYTCRIKVIMNRLGNGLLEDTPSATAGALLLPDFICHMASSLHVYDNSSITSIPAPPRGSGWNTLKWCRVERCPKLQTVFTDLGDTSVNSFGYLKTFWASDLPSATCIWDMPVNTSELNFLHLDNCPRLIHVIPFSHSLETIQIVCCAGLREVFRMRPVLPKLRRIHLHGLPMLQHICRGRMSAPKLETIKIRGCWGLRRLPAIWRNTKPPKVDCEKEWWDNLEWDGVKKNHHPSLYDPSH